MIVAGIFAGLSQKDDDIIDKMKAKRMCTNTCGHYHHAACVIERHGQILKGPIVW